MNNTYYYIFSGLSVTLFLCYVYCKNINNFQSIKNLLENNTDIELIKNTEKPSKDTSIIIHSDKFFNKAMTKGELGVAESYMDGDWTTPNLEKTLTELIKNQGALEKHIYSLEYLLLGLKNYIYTYLPNNTLDTVKKNVEHHYDIGNDLYTKMLGKHMQYTCAYFYKDELTLDEAQYAKMELIAKKLNLKEGMTVLDIGCGFGSMANHLASNYKVTVTGVTLSKEQIKLYEERFKHPNVSIVYMDYREVEDKFDRVYSVGMFEQVGKINYHEYYDKCYDLLKDNGIMLIHTIGASRDKSKSDFISTYIFPEGELPELSDLTKGYSDRWHLEDFQNIGKSYAKTLLCWYRNIDNWTGLDNYDIRFRRMWEYYLLGCSAAFNMKNIYLWQLVYTKKENKEFDCYYIRK